MAATWRQGKLRAMSRAPAALLAAATESSRSRISARRRCSPAPCRAFLRIGGYEQQHGCMVQPSSRTSDWRRYSANSLSCWLKARDETRSRPWSAATSIHRLCHHLARNGSCRPRTAGEGTSRRSCRDWRNRVLPGIGHRNADHQAEREQRIYRSGLPPFRRRRELLVDMQGLRIQCHVGEQHVVHLRHRAGQPVLDQLADGEISRNRCRRAGWRWASVIRTVEVMGSAPSREGTDLFTIIDHDRC